MVRLSDLTNQGNSNADCLRAALSVICFANASSPKGESREAGANLFALTRKPNLSLPLGEMSRSDREGWLPCEGAGLPSYGKTEGVLQIDKIRMRFALIRTCQRAALSVICFANASSPKGRAEKPVRTAHMPHQVNSCADLPACCSFRHGLRRATFLKEEGFGFPRSPNLSLPLGEMSRSDREGLYCFMPPAALLLFRRARTR